MMQSLNNQFNSFQMKQHSFPEVGFVITIFTLVGYTLVTILNLNIGFGWLAAICIPLFTIAITPRFPIVGLGAFLILLHAMPRYDREFAEIQIAMPLYALAATAVFIGWAIHYWRSNERLSWNHPVCIICLVFICWLFICFWIGYINTYQWTLLEFSRHHPINHLEGAMMFMVAYQVLNKEKQTKWFAAIFITSILVGGFANPGAIYLNGDLGAMTPIALPIAAMLLMLSNRKVVKVMCGLIMIGLVGLLIYTQNRAGLVGLGAASIFTIFLVIPNKKLGVATLAITIILISLIIPSSYVDRFSVLWSPNADHATAGLDRATIEERLQLWKCGINMIEDKPIWGVGTGNFPKVISQCGQFQGRLVAHNNFISVAAESGIPGFLLYIALILAVYYAGINKSLETDDWNKTARKMLIASFTAYLAISFFVSRHDMVSAYILMGWIAGLHKARAQP